MKNAKLKKNEKVIELLKEPFSPLVTNMKLEYEASVESVNIGSDSNKEEDIEFYHLNPFGYKKIELRSTDTEISLMETNESQGNLFLGLDSYPYHCEISLLFILNEEEVNDENKNNEKG